MTIVNYLQTNQTKPKRVAACAITYEQVITTDLKLRNNIKFIYMMQHINQRRALISDRKWCN